MKLWLLRPVENLPPDDDPWNDKWYDIYFGFVIRAQNETQARQIAHDQADFAAWLDKKYSTCEELTPDGPSEAIIEDLLNLPWRW